MLVVGETRSLRTKITRDQEGKCKWLQLEDELKLSELGTRRGGTCL